MQMKQLRSSKFVQLVFDCLVFLKQACCNPKGFFVEKIKRRKYLCKKQSTDKPVEGRITLGIRSA